MTFHIFKATRHSDDEGCDESNVLKIGTNDAVAKETDRATTIFESP